MVSWLSLLLVLPVAVDGAWSSYELPPLPLFTKVEVNRTAESTSFRVRYLASERPHGQWFVDGVPFIGGRGDFFLLNFYEGFLATAFLIVPNTLGTRFSLCLQTTPARTCLRFRPLTTEVSRTENVDFPWPLLVPAPIVRFYEGQKTRIFISSLDTSHTYTYSARFLQFSAQSRTLEKISSNGMEGGAPGDDVIIRPVTSGSPGWMLEVATDTESKEGVLLLETTFLPHPQSTETIQSCTTTRPINIYNRIHSAPFPLHLVAAVPQDDQGPLSVACRQGVYCLISCPFIIEGLTDDRTFYDVELELSRWNAEEDRMERMELRSLAGRVWMLGDYHAEARFTLTTFDPSMAGTYQCSVTLFGNTASTLVSVTPI